MTNILPVWSINDMYANADLKVHINVPKGFNVADGIIVPVGDLGQFNLGVGDLDNYIEGEPILMFKSYPDSTQQNELEIVKTPGLYIDTNGSLHQLLLVHEENNGSTKKVKKTRRRVSNVK
tara:strand:+ start:98673 stop:99035 length:363 start_codon:yes stop_codon:yes gene_type:complete